MSIVIKQHRASMVLDVASVVDLAIFRLTDIASGYTRSNLTINHLSSFREWTIYFIPANSGIPCDVLNMYSYFLVVLYRRGSSWLPQRFPANSLPYQYVCSAILYILELERLPRSLNSWLLACLRFYSIPTRKCSNSTLHYALGHNTVKFWSSCLQLWLLYISDKQQHVNWNLSISCLTHQALVIQQPQRFQLCSLSTTSTPLKTW
jgi:hypothetical protein